MRLPFPFPFVTRRRLDALAEELAATTIVNGRLTDDLIGLRARLAAHRGRRTVSDVLVEHDVHRKALADALGDQKYHLNWTELIAEVGRLNAAATAWMADHAAEKRRADRLQEQYDDAVGLGAARPLDSRTWQPGYVEPKPDRKPEVAP